MAQRLLGENPSALAFVLEHPAITAAIIYNWFNIWMKGTLSSSDIFGQEMIFLTSGK